MRVSDPFTSVCVRAFHCKQKSKCCERREEREREKERTDWREKKEIAHEESSAQSER